MLPSRRSSIFTTTVQASGDGTYSFPAGTDYTPASGTLTWGPDEQGSRSFQVATAADFFGQFALVPCMFSTAGGSLGERPLGFRRQRASAGLAVFIPIRGGRFHPFAWHCI